MARSYGTYSPAVPLGINWVESIILDDSEGVAVDISSFELRSQFYDERPVRNEATGFGVADPVFEIITTGAAYAVAPAWPVYEALTLPGGGVDGEIAIALGVEDLWTASPDNEKRKLFWELQLWNPLTNETLPVVKGSCTFLKATTLRPPA